MQKANSLPFKWRNVGFFLTAFLIVVADQLSKVWIRTNLAVGQSLPEMGFPRLTHVTNTGAAFGLFHGQWFPLTIVAIISTIVLLAYALFFYRRFPFLDNRLAWLGLGLILGGTIGNLIDRLRFHHVTDFIDFGFWPAFNISDSALVVGVIIFAYILIRLAMTVKD
jgi:signal peptidase II